MKKKIIDYIEDLEWREQEYYKLQRKIDKAISYIKNNIDNTGWLEIGSENVKELLEILGDKK